MKPFIKWAGGKRYMMDKLIRAFPKSFNTYYEPFLGGGAVFFELSRLGMIKLAILSDSNDELIITYLAVRDSFGNLVCELDKLQKEYIRKSEDKRASMYYDIRSQNPTQILDIAARFVFLNKTCFNGLYRVNKSGNFNTPHGKYKNPSICNVQVLFEAHVALQKAQVINTDFEFAMTTTKKDDLVYADPPYIPTGKEFTAYTGSGFNLNDHRRLKKWFSYSKGRECHVFVSNSDCKATRELYAGNEFITIKNTKRSIGTSLNSRRKTHNEVLIY